MSFNVSQVALLELKRKLQCYVLVASRTSGDSNAAIMVGELIRGTDCVTVLCISTLVSNAKRALRETY